MSNEQREALKIACRNADWQQVYLNGGPPCFHLDGEHFCLRAKRWDGHGDDHKFVSLFDLIREGSH